MLKSIEKIDLLRRLDELKSSLNESHGSYTIAKKYYLELLEADSIKNQIKELESSVEESIDTNKLNSLKSAQKSFNLDLNKMIREFNAYNFIAPVEKFIAGIYESANEPKNAIIFALENAIKTLTLKNTGSFDSAINDLNKIYEEEKTSANEIYLEMKNHLWIPEVKSLIVASEKAENKVTKLSESAELVKAYSPIIECEDGSFNFFLSNKWYNINEEEITVVNKNTTPIEEMYISLGKAFKIEEGTLTMFHKNNRIEIKVLENKEEDYKYHNKVYVNGKLVEGDIQSYLFSTGAFRVDELAKANLVEFAAENAQNVVELDFVTSIVSKKFNGLSANVFRLAESVYINKINDSMMENKLEKIESAKEAVNIVKEFINYDISNTLINELKSENEYEALIKNKKEIFEDRINFLNDQLSELAKVEKELGNGSTEIKEAKKILLESIEEQKSLLSELVKK